MVTLFLFVFVGLPLIYICVTAIRVESGSDQRKPKRVKQASEPASVPRVPRVNEEVAGFVTTKLERIERGVR